MPDMLVILERLWMHSFHVISVLVCLGLASQACAQNVAVPTTSTQSAQRQSPQPVSQKAHKAKPLQKASSQARPAVSSPQDRTREVADVTARLQAQAIAAAAAQAARSVANERNAPVTAAVVPVRNDEPLPALVRMAAPVGVPPLADAVPVTLLSVPVPAPAPPMIADLGGQPMPSHPTASSNSTVFPAHTSLTPAGNPHADLGPEELAIAQRIHQGVLPCERGTSVQVQADVSRPGYFRVFGKGFRYRMHPVRTSTGALRLEDAQAGAVWLQLANKSMLMDQKKGRRMADDCAHPEQVAFANDMKTNPPPMLFDTQGMGRSKD